MLTSTKLLAGFASLVCTAASYSIALSPVLGTAHLQRAACVSSRGQAAAVAGYHAELHTHVAQNRPVVMFESLGDARTIVSVETGARIYAANTRVQTFDLVE